MKWLSLRCPLVPSQWLETAARRRSSFAPSLGTVDGTLRGVAGTTPGQCLLLHQSPAAAVADDGGLVLRM